MFGTGSITRRGLTLGLVTLAACGDGDKPSGEKPGGEKPSGGKLQQETREFLLSATTFAIVAVEPTMPRSASATSSSDAQLLRTYTVLGRANIEAAAERSEIVDLIDKAIGSSDGTVAACFNPRHAVSVTKGDHRMDVLICFECHSLQVHDAAIEPGSYTIGRAPEARLNELFRSHGLRVAG